ncbi:MAG: hypothetical protein K8F91_01580, partial [Candidatus Obscuribacterales bacterium]|nr:hypothetical protein [Candidatus Obscuribacterales bacterium]
SVFDGMPRGKIRLKCASTVSTWLIEAGFMDRRDLKIRVTDMNDYLKENFSSQTRLNGNLDLSKFPQGPIGFISASEHFNDGSNHIAFVERQGDNIFIVHNKNGVVTREDIEEKFYSKDGKPRYGNIRLYTNGRSA